ncbi:unnamed protein product [Ectocarpus sp. CCAP 1310/34]|nr:unnamed protein product [Ectocarpus sp. CCAP 1310/34]
MESNVCSLQHVIQQQIFSQE